MSVTWTKAERKCVEQIDVREVPDPVDAHPAGGGVFGVASPSTELKQVGHVRESV